MIIKNVRIAFADLFTARAQGEGGEPKFACTPLIPEDSAQIALIEAEILNALEKKWPGKGAAIKKQIAGNPMRYCFRPEGEKDYDGFAGHRFFKASSKSRPLILDRDKTPLTAADGKPYSGCYVDLSVDFYAYDNNGKGVACALKGVRFVKDGDAFGGGRPATPDDFDDLSIDEEENEFA